MVLDTVGKFAAVDMKMHYGVMDKIKQYNLG